MYLTQNDSSQALVGLGWGCVCKYYLAYLPAFYCLHTSSIESLGSTDDECSLARSLSLSLFLFFSLAFPSFHLKPIAKHLPACNTDSRRDNDRICPSDTKHLCCRHHSSGTGSATFSTSQSNSYTKTQNPVWVTPTKNACIFVDFDGPDSNLRDVKHIYVEALEQLLVTDCVDNDMTGAVIYATEPNGSNNCDQAQKDKPVDIGTSYYMSSCEVSRNLRFCF